MCEMWENACALYRTPPYCTKSGLNQLGGPINDHVSTAVSWVGQSMIMYQLQQPLHEMAGPKHDIE